SGSSRNGRRGSGLEDGAGERRADRASGGEAEILAQLEPDQVVVDVLDPGEGIAGGDRPFVAKIAFEADLQEMVVEIGPDRPVGKAAIGVTAADGPFAEAVADAERGEDRVVEAGLEIVEPGHFADQLDGAVVV